MKREYIIKKKSEIDAVFKNRKQKGNSYFTVCLKENEKNKFRFAMSIGRKYGNAVERNKIKRQIRSIIRNNKEQIRKGYDFVIVIKPRAKALSYGNIERQIINLLKKNKIME